MILKSINAAHNPSRFKDVAYYRHGKTKRKKGFTLIELLFVIAIIGVVAAIAIPYLRSYIQRGYNSSVMNDLKNAYTAAQLYFSDHPAGTLDQTILQKYGFRSTDKVNLTVNDGTEDGFNLTASHPDSGQVYSIDSAGTISP